MKKMVAVVLAAGKGVRFNAKEIKKINKVMYPLAGKPMIGYTVDLLKKVGFEKIIVVVGFAKESIINYLGKKFIYVKQPKRLGTAHALKCALPKIPKETRNVFVCYSDDTAFYPPQVIKKQIKLHLKNDILSAPTDVGAVRLSSVATSSPTSSRSIRRQENKNDLTLLTVIKNNPFGLGRIIRDKQGRMIGIVEEKNATTLQKKIKEINTGCYCFKLVFLKKYLPLIRKNPVKGEYYLTDIVDLAIAGGAKVSTLKVSRGDYFQGINTKKQLEAADLKMRKKIKKDD